MKKSQNHGRKYFDRTIKEEIYFEMTQIPDDAVSDDTRLIS